jgi:hypothetical protein
MTWDDHLQQAQQSLAQIGGQFAELGVQLDALAQLRDAATAQVMVLGRAQGASLNPDAVAASIEAPYVLIRVDERTWKMVMWRGRADVPIIGEFDF